MGRLKLRSYKCLSLVLRKSDCFLRLLMATTLVALLYFDLMSLLILWRGGKVKRHALAFPLFPIVHLTTLFSLRTWWSNLSKCKNAIKLLQKTQAWLRLSRDQQSSNYTSRWFFHNFFKLAWISLFQQFFAETAWVVSFNDYFSG